MHCNRCSFTSPADAFCIKDGQIFCRNCISVLSYERKQQPKRPIGRPPVYTVEGLLKELGPKAKPDPSFFQLEVKEQIKILRAKLAETPLAFAEIP